MSGRAYWPSAANGHAEAGPSSARSIISTGEVKGDISLELAKLNQGIVSLEQQSRRASRDEELPPRRVHHREKNAHFTRRT